MRTFTVELVDTAKNEDILAAANGQITVRITPSYTNATVLVKEGRADARPSLLVHKVKFNVSGSREKISNQPQNEILFFHTAAITRVPVRVLPFPDVRCSGCNAY